MGNTSRSSGAKTADGVIATGKTLLSGLAIYTNGTANTQVVLYDNDSAASGNVLFVGGCVGANLGSTITFDRPIQAKNGIYLDITTTGGGCIVYEG